MRSPNALQLKRDLIAAPTAPTSDVPPFAPINFYNRRGVELWIGCIIFRTPPRRDASERLRKRAEHNGRRRSRAPIEFPSLHFGFEFETALVPVIIMRYCVREKNAEKYCRQARSCDADVLKMWSALLLRCADRKSCGSS